MKTQATRSHPEQQAPDTSRGELIGCLMIAAIFAASLALFHRFLWLVFA